MHQAAHATLPDDTALLKKVSAGGTLQKSFQRTTETTRTTTKVEAVNTPGMKRFSLIEKTEVTGFHGMMIKAHYALENTVKGIYRFSTPYTSLLLLGYIGSKMAAEAYMQANPVANTSSYLLSAASLFVQHAPPMPTYVLLLPGALDVSRLWNRPANPWKD